MTGIGCERESADRSARNVTYAAFSPFVIDLGTAILGRFSPRYHDW
jgi:hypothetical protein